MGENKEVLKSNPTNKLEDEQVIEKWKDMFNKRLEKKDDINKNKHDLFVAKLMDDNLLKSLLYKYFGNKSSWSGYHWVCDLKVEDYELVKIEELLSSRYITTAFTTLKGLKDEFNMDRELIVKTTFDDSLILNKTFEHQVGKKFIDLIVHIKPKQINAFSCYNHKEPIEFVIEIKHKNDFKDFGSILRQIKEYRHDYGWYTDNIWKSNIIDSSSRNREVIFCLLSDYIPEEYKAILKNEKIEYIEFQIDKSEGE